MALKNIKNFVQEQNINPNETNEWKKLIKKIIKEYKLKSKVSKDNNTLLLVPDEKIAIEKALYYVEGDKITLDYIFEGSIKLI